MSRNKRLFLIVVCFVVFLFHINYVPKQPKAKEEPYTKYIITIYSGGQEVEKFEVSSEMRGTYGKGYIIVYENEKKEVVVFASTLEYKLEELSK